MHRRRIAWGKDENEVESQGATGKAMGTESRRGIVPLVSGLRMNSLPHTRADRVQHSRIQISGDVRTAKVEPSEVANLNQPVSGGSGRENTAPWRSAYKSVFRKESRLGVANEAL